MEVHQGEIFLLYIVQNKPLSRVREILKEKYGFEIPYVATPSPVLTTCTLPLYPISITDETPWGAVISVKAMKMKLMEWGYTKNVKRAEVVSILREKERRDAAGKPSAFTLRQRPIALEKVAKHGHRAGLSLHQGQNMNPTASISTSSNNNGDSRQIACRTPPPAQHVPPPLRNQRWVVSENVLFHVDALIKGSFEAGRWRFNGNDAIIHSSRIQDDDLGRLHNFLGNLIDGSAAATTGDFSRAGTHWRQAFLAVEHLVSSGEYHDILPNLVQKLNDLNREGLTEVAVLLKQHIARCSSNSSRTSATESGNNSATTTIYHSLGNLDMSDLSDIEERIMQRFSELFTQHLGPACYNTFVMDMNRARRRLTHQPWTTFNDFLPRVEGLDARFGRADRRSLDVLGLRAEILSQRGGGGGGGWLVQVQVEVEAEAFEILERIEGIPENDQWQRLYHLVRAWFWIGQAQFRQSKRAQAVQSLQKAAGFAEAFREVEEATDIFEPERVAIRSYLAQLGESWTNAR